MQFISFLHAFYAFKSPMFYNHHNHKGDVIVIPFAMGTHQGDPLGGALFTLTHFKALHSITNLFFLSISIHCRWHSRYQPRSIVSFTYEHFYIEFHAIGLFIQLFKCVA
jgi:hypothetical protein